MSDRQDRDYRACAGVMVINTEGLIWIGRRIGGPREDEGPGHWWQMPQGGIDPGEEPSATALRELAEETGIRTVEIIGESRDWLYYDLPGHPQGIAWGGRYKGQRQKWFAVLFTGDETEIDLAPPGHKPEFEAWRWIAIDELPGLIVPFKREIYAAVVREFTPLVKPVAE